MELHSLADNHGYNSPRDSGNRTSELIPLTWYVIPRWLFLSDLTDSIFTMEFYVSTLDFQYNHRTRFCVREVDSKYVHVDLRETSIVHIPKVTTFFTPYLQTITDTIFTNFLLPSEQCSGGCPSDCECLGRTDRHEGMAGGRRSFWRTQKGKSFLEARGKYYIYNVFTDVFYLLRCGPA